MPRAAKEIVDIRSLARVHTATCIRTLASIVTQPKAPANARVAAAAQLLDRGWGKGIQPHVGDDSHGNLQVIIRHIVEPVLGEEAEPVLIEHEPARGSR
jgi:hypothetical protein